MLQVLTGPFVIRALTLPKHGVLSANFLSDLESRAPNFFKWGQAVASHPSVLGIYDENAIAERSKEKRAEKLAEKAKA